MRKAFLILTAAGLLPAVTTLAQQSSDAQAQQRQREQQQQQQQKSEQSAQQLKVSEQEAQQQVTDANKASKLMGMNVKNKQDEELGKIKDVVIDFQSGKVAYAVLQSGGTFGFGGKLVAVPIEALTLQPGDKALMIDLQKQQLSQAPGFTEDNWPDLDAARKGQTIGLAKSQSQQEAAGSPGSQPQQATGAVSSGSITNLQQLTTTEPSSIHGKQVQLSSAQVHQVLGQDTLTITSDRASQQVLVKCQQPVQGVKPGQTVQVSGKIQQMPSDPAQLGIDPSAAEKIQGQKFYIQATQVSPSKQ